MIPYLVSKAVEADRGTQSAFPGQPNNVVVEVKYHKRTHITKLEPLPSICLAS
jgi:hypothetical protein